MIQQPPQPPRAPSGPPHGPHLHLPPPPPPPPKLSGAGYSTWGLNTLGYNWWDYAQEKIPDSKVSGIGYSLAGQFVRDRLTPENAQKLSRMKVKFVDFGTDTDMTKIFDSIGLKVEVTRGQEFAYAITNNRSEVNLHDQIIIVNGLYHMQPKEVFQTLFDYVHEGGRLIIVNSAPHLVSIIFTGIVSPAPHSICVSAKLKISANEKDLFAGYGNNEEVLLEYGRYAVDVVDKKTVQVLAKIKSNLTEPLLLRWAQGHGSAYLVVSKMFLKEKEITSSEDCLKLISSRGASAETITAWKCALSVGLKNAASLALSISPSIELLARIILREYDALEQLLKNPPQNEYSQVGSMEESYSGFEHPQM